MPQLNYGTGNHTVSVGERWINILITVAGAQGGNGGSDGGNPGGTRGYGRKGTFRLEGSNSNATGVARTLYLRVGRQGGNGYGCVSNSGAGGGGSSSVASGGSGGRTGPQGCSGGGGGGGGATGVYDSYSNMYIILAGGGGGAGGGSHPDSWLRGGNGGNAGNFSGTIRSISNGSTGRSQGFDGGGGGGGGGGASGGGGGREGADDRAGRYPSTGGGGGGSYYVTSFTTYHSGQGANYANGYVNISYDLANPEITSLSTSDSTIIQGETVTVSWSTSYTQFISSLILTSPDGNTYNVTGSSSINLQPQQSGNWSLTAYYSGGRDDRSTFQTVYIPPVVTLTLDEEAMPRGDSTTLRWSTTGDATTVNIEPGVGPSNITSFVTVNPTVTTTYTAVASGLGGTDSDQITLTVWQPPEVSISGPLTVNYGQQFISLSHSEVNSDVSYQLEVIATDLDGNTTNETFDIDRSTSTYAYAPTWTNRGPSSFNFNLRGIGLGNLQDTDSILINPYIDQMPEAVDIPESEDTIKEEEPVITPDVEITTEQLTIDDIDIPVEIKADFPIQVEIDNSGNFIDVRQI
jgi:hypothetical protein